jgi:hypothetical protein
MEDDMSAHGMHARTARDKTTIKPQYQHWRRSMGTQVRSLNIARSARHANHLEFDISANTIVIRTVQSPKCIKV